MEGCAVLRFSGDSQGRARAREPHRNKSGRADFSSSYFMEWRLCPGIVRLVNPYLCPLGGRLEPCEMLAIIFGSSLNQSAMRQNGGWLFRC
jgi:hypothetical protein